MQTETQPEQAQKQIVNINVKQVYPQAGKKPLSIISNTGVNFSNWDNWKEEILPKPGDIVKAEVEPMPDFYNQKLRKNFKQFKLLRILEVVMRANGPTPEKLFEEWFKSEEEKLIRYCREQTGEPEVWELLESFQDKKLDLKDAFLAGATLSKSVASETIFDWDKVPDAKRKILLKDPNTYLRMNVKDFAEIIKASDHQTATEIFKEIDKELENSITFSKINYLALKKKHKVD